MVYRTISDTIEPKPPKTELDLGVTVIRAIKQGMNNTMGSSCSTPRQRTSCIDSCTGSPQGGNDRPGSKGKVGGDYRRSSRHSVVSAVPDDVIADLYPLRDNFILCSNDRVRSPKSLADLCTDTLCRSLVDLDGELPKGVPQEVVDLIVLSLHRHSALNATTLRALKNCYIEKLSLAGCRGVTDQWLGSLATDTTCSASSNDSQASDQMDLEVYALGNKCMDDGAKHLQDDHCPDMRGVCRIESSEASSCSTLSFISASSSPGSHMSVNRASFDSTEIPDVSDYKSAKGNMDGGPDSKICAIVSPMTALSSNLTLLDLRGSHHLTDDGLLQLSGLINLHVARFDHCNFVGRGLRVLSLSHQLRTLSLSNCRRLTDDGIFHISHLISLESLSLDGCRCLTDQSLAAIRDLSRLSKLDLSQCDLITDSGIRYLKNMNTIQELSLGWCRSITDDGLDSLTLQAGRSKFLKLLRLARCSITNTGVDSLIRLEELEELDLNGCSNVTSAALGRTLIHLKHLTLLDVSFCPSIIRTSWQGKIDSMKTLDLCYSGVRDSHISQFTNLPALEELNLGSCPVGDRAIAHLAKNNVTPNLRSLDLADSDLTDAGMVHLAKFPQLTSLSLFYCNISNSGLRHLAKLSSLESLNLDSRDISDDGLRHLRNLKKLRSLDLFSGRITDAGCSYLSKMTSLESLELCGGGIGDLGCARLAVLENLTSLNLSQNERITNRGAAALAALFNLKALNLSNTRVDSGALTYLRSLKKLQSVAFYGCRSLQDCDDLVALQNGLPRLKCLRLHNASEDEGCILTHDDDNMSAYDEDDTSDHNQSSHLGSAMDEGEDDSSNGSSSYSDHD